MQMICCFLPTDARLRSRADSSASRGPTVLALHRSPDPSRAGPTRQALTVVRLRGRQRRSGGQQHPASTVGRSVQQRGHVPREGGGGAPIAHDVRKRSLLASPRHDPPLPAVVRPPVEDLRAQRRRACRRRTSQGGPAGPSAPAEPQAGARRGPAQQGGPCPRGEPRVVKEQPPRIRPPARGSASSARS